MNIAAQSAIFFNVFVNPIALENIAWKYYVVYVCLLVLITVTVYFFYPRPTAIRWRRWHGFLMGSRTLRLPSST